MRAVNKSGSVCGTGFVILQLTEKAGKPFRIMQVIQLSHFPYKSAIAASVTILPWLFMNNKRKSYC